MLQGFGACHVRVTITYVPLYSMWQLKQYDWNLFLQEFCCRFHRELIVDCIHLGDGQGVVFDISVRMNKYGAFGQVYGGVQGHIFFQIVAHTCKKILLLACKVDGRLFAVYALIKNSNDLKCA